MTRIIFDDKDREHWENWVPKGEPLDGRLVAIRKNVEHLYQEAGTRPQLRWFTPHGPAHCREVENLIHRLIPGDRHLRLTHSEKYFLLGSAWLHDLGMIRGIFPGDDAQDESTIREEHHDRSERYLVENYSRVGVEQQEAHVFGQMARFHRRRCRIDDCQEYVAVGGHGNIRLRLLAAYLRLADALHVDVTRVPSDQYAISLTYDIPNSSKLHWLRSMFVQGIDIDPDPQCQEITIYFNEPLPGPDHEASQRAARIVDSVFNLIIDDLTAELDSVKDVLFSAGISYFLRVSKKTSKVAMEGRLQRDIATVMNEHFLLDHPSSSALVMLVLESIRGILAHPTDRLAAQVASFLADVEQKVLGTRSSHKGLERLVAQIREESTARDPKSLGAWIDEAISNWGARRKAVQDQALRFFHDWLPAMGRSASESGGSPRDQPSTSAETVGVLLYGYSEQVIEALCGFREAMALSLVRQRLVRAEASLQSPNEPISRLGVTHAEDIQHAASDRFQFFVCEGQPKNRTGWGGRIHFHDGLRYSRALAGLGFSRICIIPDAIACSLLSPFDRRAAPFRIQFVMVGANGFDDHWFAHSAGHAMVASCAAMSRQRGGDGPSLVLVVSTDKYDRSLLPDRESKAPELLFGDGWPFRGPFVGEAVRSHMFISQDPKLRETLRPERPSILLYNPMEDLVPIDCVDIVITESRWHRRPEGASAAEWSGTTIAGQESLAEGSLAPSSTKP